MKKMEYGMRELWDLLDEDRHPLAIKQVRGKQLPKDTFHQVVFIWTVSTNGMFLITKRSPNKPWGGYWENTGGSVLAGETREAGVIRELYEETGIKIKQEDLVLISEDKGFVTFEDMFLTIVDQAKQKIVLQEGETCDYQWIDYNQLEQMMEEEVFALPVIKRFNQSKERILNYLQRKNIPVRGNL